MKHLSCLFILLAFSVALSACTTTETFDPNGKLVSRERKPSPETWTAISNAVGTFGAAAVSSWTQQIADQQKWEKGEK